MKQLITTAVLLFSMTAFAQVGINNTSPKATLDITAKTTDGSKPEGLIIPQLTGDKIRAATTATPTPVYGTAQKGLIVYASTADSAPAGATASITAPGYYYFDGSAWQKIATGNTLNTSLASGNILVGSASNVATAVIPTGDVAISNAGITSIGAGKVTNGHLASAAALTVKGNATNAAASPTDIAAGTDGYVLRRSGTSLGFGTVATAGIADGAVTTAKIAADAITSTQIATGTVTNADLASAAALTVKGNATNAAASPTDIAAGTDGYVLRRSGTTLGFGTVATTGIADGAVTASKLNQMSATSGQVLGWNGSSWVPTSSDTTNDAWINDTTNGLVKLGTKADGTARSAGTDFVVKDNGQIGIGTSSPSTKLEINSSTSGAIKIVDGTQADGRVLTSDANGVGSWSPAPVTSLYFLSSSTFTGSTDFAGTTAPVSGAPSGGSTRYLSTGTVVNLGPATAITSGAAGLSYRIPVAGMYRITLYTDIIATNMSMRITAYRNGSTILNNSDSGNGSSLVMINLWNLQAGDFILPASNTVPSGTQAVETTFTVERVN
ncbi:hypothetical protein [Chryseobacterium sp. POE27]|uniref:hypothetical protein n=1 Tax=Chryseobacterium sp. POE27 TaxID=3138177 RepID=UPI00321A395D